MEVMLFFFQNEDGDIYVHHPFSIYKPSTNDYKQKRILYFNIFLCEKAWKGR